VCLQHREAAGKDAREAELRCCHPNGRWKECKHEHNFNIKRLEKMKLNTRFKQTGPVSLAVAQRHLQMCGSGQLFL